MNLSSQILLLVLLLAPSQAAVVVNTVTGVSDQNLVFSGSIPISDTNNLFFTYYGFDNQKDQNALKNYPLLIMVSSPGSSAQYLSLAGVGPMILNNDMTLSANPNRLTSYANVMFLDLLGAGFSFAASSNDIPSDAKTYGAQLTLAINTFVKESVLGQSSTIIIGAEGTFIRSLPGLDDINALKGIMHLSIWPQLYVIGRFYGIAGVELKIYTESERIAIDSTFTSCYNYQRSAKYLEAHQCLETILNFAEGKTKNTNFFDVRQGINFTEFLPMIQYYFSQPETITKFKSPNARLFESQSAYVANKTYVDLAKNYTKEISVFTKDYLSVKHWFVQGANSYISYFKGVRYWVQNQLAFIESEAFRKAKLEDIIVDEVVVGVGKTVKQVAYSELINSGHHLFNDQPKVLNALFKQWLASITQQQEKPFEEQVIEASKQPLEVEKPIDAVKASLTLSIQ